MTDDKYLLDVQQALSVTTAYLESIIALRCDLSSIPEQKTLVVSQLERNKKLLNIS